jgi:class 3 adenylate cyclase
MPVRKLVPPAIAFAIEQIVDQPDKLKLRGERLPISVLSCSIRGFTGFAEKMEPGDVVDLLNHYFARINDAILKYGGMVETSVGDTLRCFWGHSPESGDHPLRSTLCALEMAQIVEELRPVLILPGGARFQIGIGISTGPVIIGNSGLQTRSGYTVLGEKVHLAARLESLNRHYGTVLLISDSTFEACKDLIRCRELDTIRIKGKAATIYEPLGLRRFDNKRRHGGRRPVLVQTIRKLIGERPEECRLGSESLVIPPEKEELATNYESALALYRSGDLEAAEKGFDQALSHNPTDGPSRLMKGRISRYLQENAPQGSQFDPIFKFEAK